MHPDKAPEETRGEAEEAFKLLGEAFDILRDPQKKKLYDEGYDREKIEERIQEAEEALRHGKRHGGHHHYHGGHGGGCGTGDCGGC